MIGSSCAFWIFFVFALTNTSLVFSQRIVFEHFSTENGLSNNQVECLFQDRYGFIWIGTANGLNKFDGYQFTHYSNHLDEPTTISNNAIHAILESRDGALWVGTNGGLNRFDPLSETFRYFRNIPGDPNSLIHNRVVALHQDESGFLWAGTPLGLEKLNPETGTFTHYQITAPETDIPWFEISAIAELTPDPEADLIIGTWGAGVFRFNRKTGQFYPLEVEGLPLPCWVSAFFLDNKGLLWMAASSCNIYRFNPDIPRFEIARKDTEVTTRNLQAICVTQNGQMLVGRGGEGLSILGPDLRSSEDFLLYPDSPDPYSNWVTAIFEDREGGVWIGKMGYGISRFYPKKRKFKVYEHIEGDDKSLSSNIVTGIMETKKGALWVATRRDGINIQKPAREGEFTHLRKSPGGLSTDEIVSLHEDRNGLIWIGTWGHGINVFDPQKKKFFTFRPASDDPQSLVSNFINGFCETKEGELWIATTDGISVLALNEWKKGRFRNYRLDPDEPRSLSYRRADVIVQDHIGRIWIGTNAGGLDLYDPACDGFIHFRHDPYNPRSLGSDRVLDIFEDSHHRLWIGTFGGGLSLFHPESNDFNHYSTQEGLPSDEILGITEDATGYLWLTTGNGLSRFEVDSVRFTNYYAYDGLAGNNLQDRSLIRCPNGGNILCGSRSGLSVFNPDSLVKNQFVPPIVLLSLKKYRTDGYIRENTSEAGLNERREVILSYREKIITLEFAALSFNNPSKNQYAYRLRGYNEDWIYLGNKREVTFTSLRPGTYTFQVKGSNDDGIWNEEGTSLRITVLPPWWSTKWAMLIWSGLIVFLLFNVVRFQVNRNVERHEAAKLKELNDAKSAFLSTVSHELRTPLTSIMGFSKLIKKRLEEKIFPYTDLSDPKRQRVSAQVIGNIDIVISETERLTDLINDVLDLAKIEAGKVVWHMELLSIEEMIRRAESSTASLFEEKKRNLICSVAPDLPPFMGDGNRILQVLINLIFNAVKFSEKGPVRCEAHLEGSFIEVSVIDQGIGIATQDLPRIFEKFRQLNEDTLSDRPLGTGLGLPICKEIVEHHGGKIWVESTPGKGSTFVFTLPVQSETSPS
ncbi:MAG: hypothetical protein H6563_13630 [Lewinellaceae bacterium]|nr:hypothetical protein [Lewinellaceae bacterium]